MVKFGIFTKPIHVEKLVNYLNTLDIDYIISTSKPEIRAFDFDIGISYCFPHKIDIDEIVNGKKRVWYNYHPALLPEYKGVNCFSIPIMNKVKEFGVALHVMNNEIDSGEIIAVRKFFLNASPINTNELGSITHYNLFQLFKDTIMSLKSKSIPVRDSSHPGESWNEKIEIFYDDWALKYGDSCQSTMLDINTKNFELNTLTKIIGLLKPRKIVELGCGNGYAAAHIMNTFSTITQYVGVDLSKELIAVAQKKDVRNSQFIVRDICDKFEKIDADIIFTERCIINLETWEKQKDVLKWMHDSLQKNGWVVLIESFTDGLKNINDARAVIGLSPIPMPWHNHFLDKDEFWKYVKSIGFEDAMPYLSCDDCSNFLSTYYYHSRCLYPALTKNVTYNNTFVDFFKYLPAYGNYSHIQCVVLKRID